VFTLVRPSTDTTAPQWSGFDDVPADELRALETFSTELRMQPGRVIARQGAAGREVFVLVAGELRIDRDGETVAHVGPGAFVGEMAVMNHAPRNATVTSETEATVLAMTRREFSSLMATCPHLAERARWAAATREQLKAA
jgi:CRP-like cAMP-binding protein